MIRALRRALSACLVHPAGVDLFQVKHIQVHTKPETMPGRPAVLLLLLLGVAMAQAVAVVPSAVFNEMMGSWRQAPATFEDPALGSVRTVNSCEPFGVPIVLIRFSLLSPRSGNDSLLCCRLAAAEVTGLQRLGATLAFVTMKACTAQAPNWHHSADEFMYIVKGRL